MSEKSIVIVGSTGYVGGRLLKALSSRKNNLIWTLNRAGDGRPFKFVLAGNGLETIGDIRDELFLESIAQAHVIFSLAADVSKAEGVRDSADLMLANSFLPGILGSHYRNSSAHIIHVGTFSHRSDSKAYDPQTFYAATKRAGEKLLEYFTMRSLLSVTVLHTYDIYGPSQPHKRLIPTIVECLKTRRQIVTSSGEQEFRPVYVDDVVKVMIGLCDSRQKSPELFSEFDVYGPETFIVREIPSIIAKILDISIERDQVQATYKYSGKEIMKFNPCHSLPEISGEWTSLSTGLSQMEQLL
jgi:nucleoside-diphosphate-sugar epimerase